MGKKQQRNNAAPRKASLAGKSELTNSEPAAIRAEKSQPAIPARDSVPVANSELVLPSSEQNSGIPIVGIGASAGGLDALKKFFSKMPADSGVAFVLVPHLDPTHESLMVELLAKQSRMPVCEARDGMAVEPNHVYVIPPNKYLSIGAGKLQLSAPSERHASPTAIDYFFHSLAAQQNERAIGIILSGTSSHGTLGLKEIKLAGGMVMVQTPESAEYDQMPRSAIATGLVDFVLPPEEMPDALVKYVRHPYIHRPAASLADDVARAELNRILAVLKTRTKYDFRSYRKKMLMRRVLRRMGLCHLEQLSDYLDYLRDAPEEVTALYKDLLINVTEFFRDPEAFQVLQQRVVPELVSKVSAATGEDGRRPAVRQQVRIWIPACATGEEAYSLAILFIEQISAEKQPVEVQIFATDIDERSLEIARQGIYSESSLAGISAERLQRFFTRIDSLHWQVNKQLRESITFAPQNLISDAPFSKLDLIACRNLLIYLEPDVQAKVIRLFHFALSNGGYLLLGPSESIGREVDLFEPVSKKWRVFRRIGLARRALVDIPIVATDERRRLRLAARESTPPPAIGFKELMQRLILDEFAPASALITSNHEIVSVIGPLVNYLEFPAGEISKDLLALARPGLRTKIRAAVHKAIQSGESVTDLDARVKRDGVYHSCSIAVKPVDEPKDAAGLLLITFQDRAEGTSLAADKAIPADEVESHLLQHLEQELKSTREDLQSTIEEYESSTEELKASNEEIMSMNEELQSANEELETSKEELQSLNEELSTVNSQLQDKVEELDRSNSDLTNLMASSDMATVFLDTDLHIKRFTPPMAKLLNLRASDLDRPIGDLAPKFEDASLLADCRAVLDTLIPIEKEVWTKGQESLGGEKQPPDVNQAAVNARCYLRRVLPYRTGDNHIGGIVITFLDITERIAAESQSRRLATVLWDSNDAVTMQDFNGRIIAWNRGAERMYGYTEAEATKKNIRDTVPEDKRVEALTFVQRLLQGELVTKFETKRLAKDGRILDIELTATAYRDDHGYAIGVATTERDITERKLYELKLQHLNSTLEQRVADQTREVKMLAEAISHLGEGVVITADHLDWPGPKILFVNEAMCRISGYSAEELIGQTPRILQGKETSREAIDRIKLDLSAGKSCSVELVNYRKDGTPYDAELFITPLFDTQGRRTNFVSIHRDITERKRADLALRESEAISQAILASPFALIVVCDESGRVIKVNQPWEQFARENGDAILSRCGIGANYLDVCRAGAMAGDQIAQQALDGLNAVLKGAVSSFTVQYPCHSPTEKRWFLMTAIPLAVGGIVVSHVSITDLKTAEESVLRNEELLRAVQNSVPDAIITIDQRGIIATANPAAFRIFGYSQEELLGKNISLLMPSPFREEHDTYLARYLQTGEARIIGVGREVVGLRKDGSTFPVDLDVSQVDHLGLFTGIIRDISERKELQKQILKIAADEQRRIGQELHDGTGQELTGLALFAGTLVEFLDKDIQTSSDGETTRNFSEAEWLRLRETARRLSQGLVEANKHVQQLSHGILPVQIEVEGLRSALAELAAGTDALQNVTCRFDCPVPVAVANNTTATHLYRIAQEAVHNALRHGRANQIRISLLRLSGDIILEVSDNGSGFEPKLVNRSSGPRGFGLGIMNYRAGMIGGELTISRQEEGGMLVRCMVHEGGGNLS